MQQDVAKERAAIEAAVGDMTLVDVLNRNAERFGSHPAVHWTEGDTVQTMSWAGYRETVRDVAAGLSSLGIGKGEFVAIMAGNRREHVVADIGTVFAGGTPVTFYSTLAAPQIQYIADHCGAKVAIVENLEFMKRWEAAKPDLPALDYVVLMEGAENYDTIPWVLSWDEMVAKGRAALAENPSLIDDTSAAVTQDDLATLIYTSGTTGTPKGVMITQRNVVWTLECIRRTLPELPDHPRFVSYLPLAHIGERMASHYNALWLVGSVHYEPDMSQVAAAVQLAKPQVFFAVPRVWEKFQAGLMARMAAEPNERKRKLALGAIELATEAMATEAAGGKVSFADKLKLGLFERLVFSKIRAGLGLDELVIAISAAAPISGDLLIFFQGLGIPVFELFGMTESSGPGVTNVPGANKIGTVGRAMPGVEVVTAEDDEILMRGGLVTAGYYRAEDTTAETFDEQGWLHTGDLGKIDDAGYLSIIGRKKEIIITAAGKNIAPAKLEKLITKHPLISQACVVGDARKFVTVIVALDAELAPGWAEQAGIPFEGLETFAQRDDVRAEVERIIEEANNSVARAEQAKKFHLVGDEWSPESGELTPSLKLKRRVVLENYAADIEAMYKE